jgi:hypothetical protein
VAEEAAEALGVHHISKVRGIEKDGRPMIRRTFFLLLACALLWPGLTAAQQPQALFKPYKGKQSFGDEPVTRSGLPIKRSRVVQIDLTQIDIQAANKLLQNEPRAFGPEDKRPLAELHTLKRIELNLFDDKTLTADLRRVTISPDSKTVVWSGTIVDMKFGQVVLATTGSSVSGNVTTDSGSLYEIRPAAHDEGTGFILEMNQKEFPKERQPIPVPPRKDEAADVNPGTDDGSTLDVMVVYTKSAAQAAGGEVAMRNLIEIGVRETNEGYANSGVIQTIRLVHTAEVQYDESEGFEKALDRLANPKDGYMDEIPKLRDKYGADMVSLWINNKADCGLAYLMTSSSPSFESKAYSVVHFGCATGYYSFGHEMGHNQGCQHDRANAQGPGAFPYSYGLQQTAKGFRTIMAYNCDPSCRRINNWSNPDVQYNGIPTGIAITDPAAADNVLTLNNTRKTAARWRNTVLSQASAAVP